MKIVQPFFTRKGAIALKILVSGGCKNGKSMYAQHLSKHQNPDELYYLATMNPVDDEDLRRIEQHKQEREGWGFQTIEKSRNFASLIHQHGENASYLLDSTTAILANEMFLPSGEIIFNAHEKIARDLLMFMANIKNIVIVSDYIYSNSLHFDEATIAYIKGLSYIDRAIAKDCDMVIEFTFGGYIIHKGKELEEALWLQ